MSGTNGGHFPTAEDPNNEIEQACTFINRELPVPDFTADVSADLAIHRRGLSERGRSAAVKVTEDEDVTVTAGAIETLCELFIGGELSAEALAYTEDVMQLADCVDFKEEWTADVVAEFTDLEVSGIFTNERAAQIAEACSSPN